MTSPVAGAVRIMPAVGHDVPGTSTGVIKTDSVFTQRCVIQSKSGSAVLSRCDSTQTCRHYSTATIILHSCT